MFRVVVLNLDAKLIISSRKFGTFSFFVYICHRKDDIIDLKQDD